MKLKFRASSRLDVQYFSKSLILVISIIPSVGFSQQLCLDTVTKTTPSKDFTFNGNGTVTHEKTGLMWKICPEGQELQKGQCKGAVQTGNWKDALSLAETSNFSSYTDWRLPNIKELASIIERACYEPAINIAVFPDIQEASNKYRSYWTSSPVVNIGSRAKGVYSVSFGKGRVGYFTLKGEYRLHLTRLVRDAY